MFGFKGLAKIKKFLNVGQGEPPVKEPTSYPTIKKIFGRTPGTNCKLVTRWAPKKKN